MDQYNPFENSNHKIPKNSFEKKNKRSGIFEPTSNNYLESWDTYKKSEKRVKKYTNKQVIKEKDLNTVNTNTIKPSINIPKNLPKISVNNTEKSKRLGFIIAVLVLFGTFFSTIGNFIEDSIENSIEYNDDYEYELTMSEELCYNVISDIQNNNFTEFDVSKIQDAITTYDINLDEFKDSISNFGTDSIYTPYDDYENKDLNHRLDYIEISDWDDDLNDFAVYTFIFNLEGENINEIDSDVPGKILGIELIKSKNYNGKDPLDIIKCGNCEYKGKALEYYLQSLSDD